MGTTCEYPPPAAPPFMPKQGPREGSRNAMIALLPRRLSACPRPTVVVDLPSPAGVGVMAETSTSGASGRPSARAMAWIETLALSRP